MLEHFSWYHSPFLPHTLIVYKRRRRNDVLSVKPLEIEGYTFVATTVELPKTTLLIISNDIGYIMCAALDVDFFNENEKLRQREVIAGRAEGVRTIEQLLHAPLAKITDASKKYGWEIGMIGKDALLKLT